MTARVAVRRCLRTPMSGQGTTCNCTSANGTGSAPQSGCIGLLLIYSIHKSAMDWRGEKLLLVLYSIQKSAMDWRGKKLLLVSYSIHKSAMDWR